MVRSLVIYSQSRTQMELNCIGDCEHRYYLDNLYTSAHIDPQIDPSFRRSNTNAYIEIRVRSRYGGYICNRK